MATERYKESDPQNGSSTRGQGHGGGQEISVINVPMVAVTPEDEDGVQVRELSKFNRFKQYVTHKQFEPRAVLGVLQFTSALLYIMNINIKCLPQLPHPLVGNLLPERFQDYNEVSVITLLFMWGIHFLRRFTEILFVHVFRHRISILQIMGYTVHFLLFGFWIGWSVNFKMCDSIYTLYRPPPASLVGMGVIIFLLGEIGNCASHVALRKMRTSSRKSYMTDCGHALPTGFWFKYISGPQYFFEVLSWLGFAIAAFTLPAILYLGVSTVILVISARSRHREYLACFNGQNGQPDYSKLRRKIIFPGVY